jgi:peptidoglycan/xylan/chitin deacetylase (PgdA/CDA1 family)
LKPLLIDAWRWGTMPWRWWARATARRKGTMPVGILFYHRVADDDPNPWTITCEGFRRQIDWLSANFDIVSLAEAQNRIRSGHNTRPTLCLTFDDGYADNSAFALPLLIQRNIPVTYFVTTWHTAEGQPFAHDVARRRPLAPNCPSALKAMADAGVEIGAHTRHHRDLGAISDPRQLYDEVILATREMEQMIERPIRYFAFPFGQVENLNSLVFRLARDYGFAGVCSAYGGWNEIGSDAFHLQRFHGDPNIATLKNWLTLDPRKRRIWQTRVAEEIIRKGLSARVTPPPVADRTPVSTKAGSCS